MVEAPQSRRRRRWLLIVATLAAVVVVTVAGAAGWWFTGGAEALARSRWQPPEQTFLSSMREQPVAGWRTRMSDLGLPAPTDGGEPSRIAASNDPNGPRPFIGSLGNNAYFLASSSGTPGPQWWLVVIDVHDGRSPFAPVQLGTATMPPQCFLNGPDHVLCLNVHDDSSFTASVVDARSGAVVYTGPTDLRLGSATLSVRQAGNYAVAETHNQGVYGIGPRTEATWFVPGDGRAQIDPPNHFESVPQEFAAQYSSSSGASDTTVFSLSDGGVIRAQLDDGTKLGTVKVYPGGFAAQVEAGGKPLGIQFFDDNGQQVGERGVEGTLTDDSMGLPIVTLRPTGQKAVFSPDGEKLMDLPDGATELVGATLFVNENRSSTFPMWREYDLKTGDKGPACDFNMSNYLGTDGSVIVFGATNRKADVLAKARDLATCDTLWTLPSEATSLGRIWRVNTTLVQLSDDGTELMSLVPPG